ncbi:glycoside hydrolase superfamily [Aspergillus multicolor]|uniref:endo alpha-1,4 polygalactosaminidase n=1 Tax=Aspergillus multicolor TaxID=41759 RepID=UPI003CCCCCE1
MASITLWNITIIALVFALAALGNAAPAPQRRPHWGWNHDNGNDDQLSTETATWTLPWIQSHTPTPTPTGYGNGNANGNDYGNTPTSPSAPASTSTRTPAATPTSTSSSSGSGSGSSSSNSGDIWQPAVGSPWQIILSSSLDSSAADTNIKVASASPSVSIYDIDLYENDASTISSLKSQGINVICYFSAGTYENWREDASSFSSSDLGAALPDWEGENWLDLRSDNVRAIMSSRLDTAKAKGCDGVDPDNVDAYGNDAGGLGLTEDDSVDYVNYLAEQAHSRGLSIGLKNAGAIIPRVIDNVQFSVNEQCAEYNECDVYQVFLEQNKPVFHIEYPAGGEVSTSNVDKASLCQSFEGAEGFSTVIKDMDLGEWVQEC